MILDVTVQYLDFFSFLCSCVGMVSHFLLRLHNISIIFTIFFAVTFMQKHEIRQVYVRSTARVYEIYYKLDVHSSNEYLCTVRCSVAAREDDLLRESNHVEASSEPTKESDRDYIEKKSSSSATEDDWVEVKNPESHVEVINSLPEGISGDEKSLQVSNLLLMVISQFKPLLSPVLVY